MRGCLPQLVHSLAGRQVDSCTDGHAQVHCGMLRCLFNLFSQVIRNMGNKGILLCLHLHSDLYGNNFLMRYARVVRMNGRADVILDYQVSVDEFKSNYGRVFFGRGHTECSINESLTLID